VPALDHDVLTQLASSIGDGIVTVAVWAVVLGRIGEQLELAGYPGTRTGGRAP